MGYIRPLLKSYTACGIAEELGAGQTQYTTTTLYTETGSGGNCDGYMNSGAHDPHTESAIAFGDSHDDSYDVGFVGFDISSIQSTIVSAKLKLYQAATLKDGEIGGDPYPDLGTVVVDHVNFGDELSSSDWDLTPLSENIGTLSTDATVEWKPSSDGLDVAEYVQADVDAGRSYSQFRIRFTTTVDPDSVMDAAAFEDAEDYGGTGNKPELVISYY